MSIGAGPEPTRLGVAFPFTTVLSIPYAIGEIEPLLTAIT